MPERISPEEQDADIVAPEATQILSSFRLWEARTVFRESKQERQQVSPLPDPPFRQPVSELFGAANFG